MTETFALDKETFYVQLLKHDTPIKTLFENYGGDDYVELFRFVNKMAQLEYAIPNDNPENQKGKPFITKEARRRWNIFARTLEHSTTYNEDDLTHAIQFVEHIEKRHNYKE